MNFNSPKTNKNVRPDQTFPICAGETPKTHKKHPENHPGLVGVLRASKFGTFSFHLQSTVLQQEVSQTHTHTPNTPCNQHELIHARWDLVCNKRGQKSAKIGQTLLIPSPCWQSARPPTSARVHRVTKPICPTSPTAAAAAVVAFLVYCGSDAIDVRRRFVIRQGKVDGACATKKRQKKSLKSVLFENTRNLRIPKR